MHTVALVGMDASIDFMCFPRFDSPTIFAALLDDRSGGRFQLAPVLEHCRQKQLYLPDSAILLTRFLSEQGVAETSDFMPVPAAKQACIGQPSDLPSGHHVEQTHTLVRRIRTVRGEVKFRMVCDPRFDYGRSGHRVLRDSVGVVFEPDGGGQGPLRLRTSTPLQVENGVATAEFSLRAGESADFILEPASAGAAESPTAAHDYVPESFKRTMNFWRRWTGRSNYRGRWRETINRSALTLKLLTSHDYGSIVAAPTFSLPEQIGGGRNWDYRYTWIRDSCFSLEALMRLGYNEEATAFMNWLSERCAKPDAGGLLRVLYGIDGRTNLDEGTLDHLEGYRQSRPVRIGNGAINQLQLDIYGELLIAVDIHDRFGVRISHEMWQNLLRLIEYVCANWAVPDECIWEFRNGRQEFLYSRVMCWVALERAMRISRRRSLPAPLARWRRIRDEIYWDIVNNFWDQQRGVFVQHKGTTALDASCLMMPLVGFISPTDPRWLSTLRALEHDLLDDSLVYRYESSDGIAGREGTFVMCSFWYIDCLARAGDVRLARLFFEKMIGYANHLGLFSEEIGPAGDLVGNFPQAFSHVALICSAITLDRSLSESPDTEVES